MRDYKTDWDEQTDIYPADINRWEQNTKDIDVELSNVKGVAIVEEGVNNNGRYIRWANGLQFCQTSMSTAVIQTASGALYRSESYTWNFPARFESSKGISVSSDVTALFWWPTITGIPSDNSVTLRTYGTTPTQSVFTLRAHAWGWWK